MGVAETTVVGQGGHLSRCDCCMSWRRSMRRLIDDPHLVSRAGLVPVMALAQRAGLGELAAEHVRIARPWGVNAPVKIACLAARMAARADSIDDMDLLCHGAMPLLFGGIRAP